GDGQGEGGGERGVREAVPEVSAVAGDDFHNSREEVHQAGGCAQGRPARSDDGGGDRREVPRAWGFGDREGGVRQAGRGDIGEGEDGERAGADGAHGEARLIRRRWQMGDTPPVSTTCIKCSGRMEFGVIADASGFSSAVFRAPEKILEWI